MSTTAETAAPAAPAISSFQPRYVDIGINLTDPVFSGNYYGTQRHESDLSGILSRARSAGCQKLIITGSDLKESTKAIELAKQHPGFLYATVGVHPCSSLAFSRFPKGPSALLKALKDVATTGASSSPPTVVAFGEIGLDYDRLTLCPADVQLQYFAAQLDIATQLSPALPLFLHSRAASADFVRLLRERLDKLPKRGVVHSFTGTLEEMQELVEMGFDIGINGCSLKTEENLAVTKQVPLERLQLETDGPWCEIRPSHASAKYLAKDDTPWKSVKKEKWAEGAMIKGRNEPCMIGKVAVVVAGVKGLRVEEVSEAAWQNSVNMFGIGSRTETPP